MKTCNRCKDEKDDLDFSDKSRRCKECQNELSKAHYQNNKEYYLNKGLKRRRAIVSFLRKIKESTGCFRCDENRGICLDFHHEYDKEFTIHPNKGYTNDKYIEEIKKCIILCANCHRIEHTKYGY